MTNVLHGQHKCVRYFLLLQWDPEFETPTYLIHPDGRSMPDPAGPIKGRWTVEYGAYTRRDVKDEREYYHLSGNVKLKHLRIKEICSCEAGLEDQLRVAAEEPRP